MRITRWSVTLISDSYIDERERWELLAAGLHRKLVPLQSAAAALYCSRTRGARVPVIWLHIHPTMACGRVTILPNMTLYHQILQMMARRLLHARRVNKFAARENAICALQKSSRFNECIDMYSLTKYSWLIVVDNFASTKNRLTNETIGNCTIINLCS